MSTIATPFALQVLTPLLEPIAAAILSVKFCFRLCHHRNSYPISPRFSWQENAAPATFTDSLRTALEKAATDAGVYVLQLLDEADSTSLTDLW